MGQSAIAVIGWGINFNNGEYDELHESVVEIDSYAAFDNTEFDDLFDLFNYGYSGGYDDDRMAILIKRSKHDAMPTMPHVIEDTLTLVPPLDEEIAQLNAALDYIGYTGPRKVELLLLAEYG
jgi:hypothetical protein